MRELFDNCAGFADGSVPLDPISDYVVQALIGREVLVWPLCRVPVLRVLKAVTEAGLLGSDTEKGAISLRFPAGAIDMLFPRRYPEGV